MADPSPSGPAIRGFVFDMDGTLAVGDPGGHGFVLLPGVTDLIAHLRAAAVPFLVFTNGSAHPPERYAANLITAGLDLDPAQMMTPSSVAADYFTGAGFRRVLLLGVDGTAKPLTDAGIEIVRPGDGGTDRVDAVYVGWHPEFGLGDIKAASDAVFAGAPIYLSSDVPFFFSSKGRTLGISRLIGAAVTSATGRRAKVVGKPSSIAARIVASRLGCGAREIAIVGDDPRLEASMARRSGAVGIGVTTGLTDRATWALQPAGRRPDYVCDRIDEIIALGFMATGKR